MKKKKVPSKNSITTKEKTATSVPDLETRDYYVENGLYVFTEQYHLKRGYCCGNGCRHCPYKEE